MRSVLLSLLFAANAFAGQVTVYHASGFGTVSLHVDGKFVVKIKPGQRVVLDLPNGRRYFRNVGLDTSCAIEVNGNHILRLSSTFTEVSPEDPKVKDELTHTEEIKP